MLPARTVNKHILLTLTSTSLSYKRTMLTRMKPSYRAVKLIDDRTTRKNNNTNQTTNIIYDQNSMSTIKKIIKKSNLH